MNINRINEKTVEKVKLKNDSNEKSVNKSYKSILNFLDNQDIDKIKEMSNNINKNYVIFDLYNNKLLTENRLKFIMNDCTSYLNISSNLIKRLKRKKNYFT